MSSPQAPYIDALTGNPEMPAPELKTLCFDFDFDFDFEVLWAKKKRTWPSSHILRSSQYLGKELPGQSH